MLVADHKMPQSYKLLIITSSAGGGLLQAAVAQEHQAKAENPQVQIIKRDVLKDWVWKWLGKFSIESWNKAQKKGDVRSQKFYASFHWFFDYITWPSVFYHTLRTLLNEDIDRVIDTQTTSTSAVLSAIRFFNRKRYKHVVLEKVVVDLPTKKATHFFRPIRSLSKKGKKYLKLRTIAPLLEEGQTEGDFWRTHCGLSDSEIYYEDVNVRKSFRAYQGKPRTKEKVSLSLRYKTSEELQLMRQTWIKGDLSAAVVGDQVRFDIPPEAHVITILLGSQPARSATINYVNKFIEIAKKLPPNAAPIFIFVFCADHISHTNSLFQEVANTVQAIKDFPRLISVVPFSFQEDDVIAPLFHRSDITCSRSGGQTAMELMAVSTGEIWIHSETKKKTGELTLEELLKGIPVWESESALYLVKLQGAKLVTPDIFSSEAVRILELLHN